MAINTQTIRIDLNPGKTIPVAFVHQNDTNRQLTFQLYNNGEAFTPSSTTVKFAYKSPIVNGQYSVITGSQMASGTVSGNTVTVTLPAAYTQVSGVGLLTMILTTSGNTLRPVNIKFVCQSSADGDDQILNASDWPEGLYDYMDNWLEENEPTEIANLKSDLSKTVFCENLLGDAGNFVPQNSWYKMTGTSSYSATDGVASYNVAAQWGGIKSLQKFTLTTDHKFYVLAKVKSATPQTLTFDGFGSVQNSGSGSFEFISMIVTGTGLERSLTIIDGNTSGFGQVQAKDIGLIDLTETFGENVPSKDALDSMFSSIGFFKSYPIGKFVGAFYSEHLSLENKVDTIETTANENSEKIGAFIENLLGSAGKFSPSSTWFKVSASEYSVSSNTASFKASSQYGGIKTYTALSIPQGHKMYAFAKLKGNSNHRITFATTGSARASGTGDFEFVSFIETHSNSNAVNMWVIDASTSGFETCYVKDCGVIDLTETFGDTTPTKEQLDSFISSVGFFDTFPLGEFVSSFYSAFLKLGAEGYPNISDKVVAILGDSITQTNAIDTSGNLTPDRTNWPTYALPLLGNPTVYNFAQDGSSYHDFTGSGTYQTFTKQYDLMVSKGIQPDLIVLSFGTNDMQYAHTDTYDSAMAIGTLAGLDKTNLYQAVRWAFWTITENYPNATIVVGTPTQRADTDVYNVVREAIIKMAQTYCLNIADATTESGIIKQFEKIPGGGAGRYLSDGLHPNTDGKQLLGKYYAWKISQYFSPNKN